MAIVTRDISPMCGCYTDFWESYKTVMPANRHRAVGKASDKTNHFERFDGTLRQRVSRLLRKTLSFSQKIDNLM